MIHDGWLNECQGQLVKTGSEANKWSASWLSQRRHTVTQCLLRAKSRCKFPCKLMSTEAVILSGRNRPWPLMWQWMLTRLQTGVIWFKATCSMSPWIVNIRFCLFFHTALSKKNIITENNQQNPQKVCMYFFERYINLYCISFVFSLIRALNLSCWCPSSAQIQHWPAGDEDDPSALMEREHQRPQLSRPVGLDSPGSPSRAALFPLVVIFFFLLSSTFSGGNWQHGAKPSFTPGGRRLVFFLCVQSCWCKLMLRGLSVNQTCWVCQSHWQSLTDTSEVSTKWRWLKVNWV